VKRRGRPRGSRDRRPRKPRFAQTTEPNQHDDDLNAPEHANIGHNGGPRFDREEERRVSQQFAWKTKQWGKLVGIGLSSVQALIKTGEIQSLKIGSQMVLITTPPAQWVERKLREQAALPAGEVLPKIRRTKPSRPHLVKKQA
jgi:hypothetical protein